jgi:hypothetical protein
MTGRPDPIDAWREVSAEAARSTGYRAGPVAGRVAGRRSGLASIGAMTAALLVIVAALALRPSAGPAANGPVDARSEDGMFRLELTTPRGEYVPGYPIAPVASLTYLGPDGTVSVHFDTAAVQFRVEEVGGSRVAGGGSRLICASTNLVKDSPLDVPFAKAGSPTDDPTAGFDQAWYLDRTLTLPVGTWRIVASIDLGVDGCAPSHHLTVSNVIHVVAPSGDGPVVDDAQDNLFRLDLTTPRRIYSPQDAIEPVATVSFLGPAAQMSIYHGGSIVGWVIEEVGGNRTMSGGMTLPCASGVIRRDTPLTFPFEKSGAIGQTFDQAWFDDPVLHLPVGTWRIRAYTTISADDGPSPSDGSFTCGTRGHGMEAANVITVVGGTAPSTAPSLVPTSAPPSPLPSFTLDPVVGTAEDPTFRLALTTPHGIFGPNDAIGPVATLTYRGPSDTITYGHGAPAVSFAIEEIGGDRQMSGGVDDVCQLTTLDAATPATIRFQKGGQVGLGFDQAWFADPVLRLPVGTWRISATLEASVPACGQGSDVHRLTAENVIQVVDNPPSIPSPSVDPSAAAAAADVDMARKIVSLYESARATGGADAWQLLSPWSRALYGSEAAFDRIQADLNASGYAHFVIAAPTQDPELLSPFFLGARAADLAANADPARTFLVTVHYPDVSGAAAGTLNLVVGPRRSDPTDWAIWVDGSPPGPGASPVG